jgi:hypothetical protein
MRWFFLTYTALVIGAVGTVAEGAYLPDILNYTEHIGIAAAGLLFARASYLSAKRTTDLKLEIARKVEDDG